VAFGHDQVVVSGECAENRHRPVGRVADQLGVPFAADVVEDDTGDVQLGVEAGVAVDERGRAACHGACVDDKQHGEIEQLGDLGGAAALAFCFAAVVEAHHALDQGDVGVGAEAGEPFLVLLRCEHPAVEVARRPRACLVVVERVDEVGADFERLHGEAAAAERPDQPERDACLADAAVGAGNDERAQRASVGVWCACWHVLETLPQPIAASAGR